MIFKYQQLVEFFSAARKKASVIPLCQWQGEKSIILRHDIDVSVEAAARMADLEQECGVRSTFFFLVTSSNYNLMSATNQQVLRDMSERGFEVALHFDPTVYPAVSDEQLTQYVHREADILAQIVGEKIESVSLHNPSLTGQFPLFPGYNNAYDKKIFSNKYYLSDSRMQFRGKDPFQFLQLVEERVLQILLHPLHYSESGSGYTDIVRKHVQYYLQSVQDSFIGNEQHAQDFAYKELDVRVINKHLPK